MLEAWCHCLLCVLKDIIKYCPSGSGDSRVVLFSASEPYTGNASRRDIPWKRLRNPCGIGGDSKSSLWPGRESITSCFLNTSRG